MLNPKIIAGLKECVAGGRVRFLSYGQFGSIFGLGTYAPAWANRNNLDAVARECKEDPDIGLDLTFLLRNSETGYPSVVDGKAYDAMNPGSQIIRSRQVARQIIDKFGPGTKNPY